MNPNANLANSLPYPLLDRVLWSKLLELSTFCNALPDSAGGGTEAWLPTKGQKPVVDRIWEVQNGERPRGCVDPESPFEPQNAIREWCSLIGGIQKPFPSQRLETFFSSSWKVTPKCSWLLIDAGMPLQVRLSGRRSGCMISKLKWLRSIN